MIRSKAFTRLLVLSAAFAVSACATEASYISQADDYAYSSYLRYPYECSYDFGYECPPYVYGPPAVFDFNHFDHLHDHSAHVARGLGGFRGHGFAGHGGFGFGGRGGGGHR
jgi:hypothetical protein